MKFGINLKLTPFQGNDMDTGQGIHSKSEKKLAESTFHQKQNGGKSA